MTTRAEAEAAADELGAHALLNCFVREVGGAALVPTAQAGVDPAAVGGAGQALVVPLGGGARLVAGVATATRTARHRYHLPALACAPGADPRPVGLGELAALLVGAVDGDGAPTGTAPDVLLARVADSAATMADALAARAGEVDRLWGPGPLDFATAEQALLVGHMVHPTPKSRMELSAEDRRSCSPELGASFPLHWFSVRRQLLHHDSALPTPAPELARALAGLDPGVLEGLDRAVGDPAGWAHLPAHPWEARHLLADPAVAALVEAGDLRAHGPAGGPWRPTTSVRTVARADAPWMLKFSLHVRLTNYLRVTLPKELDRAVEAARLFAGPVGERARRVAPTFVALPDPAFLAVRRDGRAGGPRGGPVLDGFSVLFRHHRWQAGGPWAGTDVTSLTALCQDHPFGGPSRLGALVADLARRSHLAPREAGRAWFGRFCEVAVEPLVRLYLDVGLCFEPHSQNLLLELEGGWPARCAYRDSQGYFHREAAHADLAAVVPGLGEASESIFPEALADERLTYYLFVNSVLGVVNALAVAGVADEGVLLADLRRRLEALRRAGGRYPATLLDVVLDSARLPCKGNLRTRLHDMDELVGDIATQSVYVTVPNPLAGVGT